MAWLQRDPSNNFHISFRFGGTKFKRSLRTKNEKEAEARRQRLEENIRLVDSGRIELPDDADVPQFLLSDGKQRRKPKLPKVHSIKTLFDEFFDSIPDGNLEQNTINLMEIHQRHLVKHLGSTFRIQQLATSDLQRYVNQRAKENGLRGRKIGANTIKKELATLRTVWNWAAETGRLSGSFPRNGIRYPKTVEKPPFQTWKEIERRIKRENLNDNQQADLWDCLYLGLAEIEELLDYVCANASHPWVYPMFVMAAHTGARRSEMLRSEIGDFDDLEVIVRERKRKRGQHTTRRIPLSSKLHSVIQRWLGEHPGGNHTFCHGAIERSKSRRTEPQPITRDEANDHFHRTLQSSKWKVIRGWHCLRHSFISNLASSGVDQRMIDEFVGHTTESMRRRYRHLFPETKSAAIQSVFG